MGLFILERDGNGECIYTDSIQCLIAVREAERELALRIDVFGVVGEVNQV